MYNIHFFVCTIPLHTIHLPLAPQCAPSSFSPLITPIFTPSLCPPLTSDYPTTSLSSFIFSPPLLALRFIHQSVILPASRDSPIPQLAFQSLFLMSSLHPLLLPLLLPLVSPSFSLPLLPIICLRHHLSPFTSILIHHLNILPSTSPIPSHRLPPRETH